MVLCDCRIATLQGWSRHYYVFASSGMSVFYSAIAHLVSWLGSLIHAFKWAAGQNFADPTTWNSSALQTLKQLHGNLLTHYKVHSMGSTSGLLCVFCRMRTMAKLLFVRRRYLHNVRSQSTSCKRGRCISRCCEIRLRTACMMYTCFITPNQCPQPHLSFPLPRERVLFIGTQFSILYTFMHSPA